MARFVCDPQVLFGMHRSPLVKLRPPKTFIGKPLSAKVAYFSSRGPNSITPAILKVCILNANV